ncbi:MAG: hypothetical protein ACRDMV_16400 [Streptosporangiales bacterium]
MARFTDGYHLFADSGEHWVHVYLYRHRTAAGADRLARSFWKRRDSGGSRFAVHEIPGARGSVNRPSYARAVVRFTVGNVYAEVFANTNTSKADTKVATELAKKQYRKLTAALS